MERPRQGPRGTGTRLLSFVPFPPKPASQHDSRAKSRWNAHNPTTEGGTPGPPLFASTTRSSPSFLGPTAASRLASHLHASRPSPSPKSRQKELEGCVLVAEKPPEGAHGRSVWGSSWDAATFSHTEGGGVGCEGMQGAGITETSRCRGLKPGRGEEKYLRKSGAGRGAGRRSASPRRSRASQTVARKSLHASTARSETSRQSGATPPRANRRTELPAGGGGGAGPTLRWPRPEPRLPDNLLPLSCLAYLMGKFFKK